jgi:ATP-dependent protease ClpP protease subunit
MLSVNQNTGELFLYGVVGSYYYEDCFSSLEVISALATLGSKRAQVHINSPGGLADEGVAIYGALKRHAAGVDTHIDALAASAASVIALAGETRTTAAGARWMIHRSMTWAEGNESAFDKAKAQCQAYDKSLMEIYSAYMPDGTDIMALMEAETWYTGPESVAVGLSTTTGGSSNAKPAIASWFKNPPAALVQQSVRSHGAYARAKAFRTNLLTR